MEKIGVFIDNSNIFKTIKKIRESDKKWSTFYDPLELGKKAVGNRELVFINFYCVKPPVYLLDEDKEHKNKFIVTEKYYSHIEKLSLVNMKYGELKGPKGETKEKNLDTQLATDLVTVGALGRINTAIIVSNDGDYVSAVNNVKEFGIKVELISFKGFSSMALRKIVDINRRARLVYFKKLSFLD